jgi:hypothetical protein
MLTSLTVSDSENFKHLIFYAQCVETCDMEGQQCHII